MKKSRKCYIQSQYDLTFLYDSNILYTLFIYSIASINREKEKKIDSNLFVIPYV